MKTNKLMLLLLALLFSFGAYACDEDTDVTDGDTSDGDAIEAEQEAYDNTTDGDLVADGDVTVTDGDTTDGDAVDGDAVDGDVIEAEQEIDGDVTDSEITDSETTDSETTDSEQASLASNKVFSACGGFDATKEEDLCRDEEFVWTYDEQSQKLTVINKNVWLNCCGDHSLNLKLASANSYYLTEIDDPENGNGRCSCMCFFDFGFDLEDVSGTLTFSIARIINEMTESGSHSVWEGSIDLSENSGSITIQENLGYCD